MNKERNIDFSKFTPEEAEAYVISKIMEEVADIRIKIVQHYPFLTYLVFSCDIVTAKNLPFTAAATTEGGNKIFIHPIKWESRLNGFGEKAFVFLHEVMHIFLEHINRARENNYHHKLYNVATDLSINLTLDKLGGDVLKRPSWVLYDARWQDKKGRVNSADYIYHKLLEENDGDPDKAADSALNGGCDGEGGQELIDQVSAEEADEAQTQKNRQTAQASSQLGDGKQMGSGSADLLRQLAELFTPKIPWSELIYDTIVTKVQENMTYRRVSRKSTDVIFPTYDGERVAVFFNVDTSGSMSDEDLAECVSELKGLMDQFDSWKVVVGSCDTKYHEIAVLDSEDGDDIDDIKSLVGGGGTDMQPLVDMLEDTEHDDCVVNIILTDGYIPKVENNTDIQTILVVTSNGAGLSEVEGLVSGNIIAMKM